MPRTRTRDCLLIMAVAAGLCASTASFGQSLASLPQEPVFAAAIGEARPLAGWLDFCRRHPAECAWEAAEPEAIAMTPRIWSAIVSVNRAVNARIRAVTDEEHWAVPDRWDLPSDRLGDCEDFQLLKRKLLAAEGLPRRAMRMTVVVDEKGEGHAVLMVRTDRGDLVLDNKTNSVLPWHRTGYVFVKRESQDRLGWVSLGGATSPIATANR